MTDPYRYSSLPDNPPSIRLITIQPSPRKADPIRCDIQHVSLSSNPTYDALSYTWDLDRSLAPSEPTTYSISLADHPVPVAPNLYFALQQVRQDVDQPRTLWIDAICINQNDNVEKGKQVQAMSAIYTQARRVLVWLGEEEEPYDASAFALIERFQRAFPVPQSCDLKTIMDFKVRSIQDDNLSWQALGALLRRRWFSRVWVLQEVAMAREALVMSGARTIPWATLADVVSIILRLGMGDEFRDRRGSPLGTFIVKVQQLKALLASGEKLELLNALGMTRTLDATDPRDKIFSVLGFARDADFLTPDYGLSINELLRRVNISCVAPTPDLRFLSYFDARSIENPCRLTPWGPNFLDIELDREAFKSWGAWIEGSVAGSRAPHVTVSEDGSCLTIRGIIFDQIDQRSCRFSRVPTTFSISSLVDPLAVRDRFKAHIAQMGKYLSSCQKVALGARASTHPGHDACEAFWRTLICNLDMQCRIAPASFSATYLAFVQGIFLADVFHKLPDTAQGQYPEIILAKGREGSPFEGAMSRAAAGRVFCITKGGYMGMMPAKAKRGDVVCAFLGAYTMFVIRRKEEGRGGEGLEGAGLYRLIGECYIHGMMDEEVLGLKDFESRVVDITLG